jgi:uncharacterized protein YdeI (YjbR/CyaY-like superfamily)
VLRAIAGMSDLETSINAVITERWKQPDAFERLWRYNRKALVCGFHDHQRSDTRFQRLAPTIDTL